MGADSKKNQWSVHVAMGVYYWICKNYRCDARNRMNVRCVIIIGNLWLLSLYLELVTIMNSRGRGYSFVSEPMHILTIVRNTVKEAALAM